MSTLFNDATVYVADQVNALQDRISASVNSVADKVESGKKESQDASMNVTDFKMVDRMRREMPITYRNLLTLYTDITNQSPSPFDTMQASSTSAGSSQVVNANLQQLFRNRLGTP